MMDEADKAEEFIEARIEDAISHARYMIETRSIKPCGSCHYCNGSVRYSDLFCDDECKKDWVWEQNQKRIAGR